MERTYLLPETEIDALTKVVAQLNRRAERISTAAAGTGAACPTITLDLVRTVDAHEDDGTISRWHEVRLTTPPTSFNVDGQTTYFVAVIEHNRLPDGSYQNLVRNLPGVTQVIPDHFRTAPPHCERCTTLRRRRDTYIAVHLGTMQFQQVGRDCLHALTGCANAEAILTFLASADPAVAAAAEQASARQRAKRQAHTGWEPFGSYIDTLHYLTQVAAAIRVHGWVSASSADARGLVATAARAVRSACAPHAPTAAMDRLDVQPDDRALAEAALCWCHTTWQPRDDWELRMAAAVAGPTMSLRAVRIAAPLIVAYQRTIAPPQPVTPAPVSAHLGTIGARITVDVEVLRATFLEDRTFPCMRHYLRDRAGNIVIWHASTQSLHEGAWYRLTGTVSDHQVWTARNEAQTVLKRCRVAALPASSATSTPALVAAC